MSTFFSLRKTISTVAVVACTALHASAMAQQLDARAIYVNSVCKYPVRLVVHHKDSQADHHPHGWYVFEAYEENRLQANDVVLRQVVGENLYFYAETLRRSGVPEMVWGGSDATASFEGVSYDLKRAHLFVNQRGQLELKLTCRETS